MKQIVGRRSHVAQPNRAPRDATKISLERSRMASEGTAGTPNGGSKMWLEPAAMVEEGGVAGDPTPAVARCGD